MEFIRGTTLVHLKIRAWSGQKKASRDQDIKLGKDGKMPPAKLLDLGNKKIFNPKALDPMDTLRKAAERACGSVGTRFMGGYAIPDNKVDELVSQLEVVQEKYGSAVQEFLNGFESSRDAWLNEEDVQEYAHIIRQQIPDKSRVSSAFNFEFKLYKLDPVPGYEPDESEIANQVLHEIGMTCKDMAKRLIERKTAISGAKLFEQFDPLIEKLDALSFGNGRLLKVLSEFEALQNSIPLSERIDSAHPTFGHTVTFLSMCSDSFKLDRIIDGSFSVVQMIHSMTSQPSPSVVNSATSTDDAASSIAPSTSVPKVTNTSAYF